MRLIQIVSDDVMVAEFLRAEIESKRFGSTIRKLMDVKDSSIVTHPNLNHEDENNYRKWLLGEVRGYRRNCDLFEKFPSNVKWYNAIISKEELKSVMYIDYSYWNELSGDTRLPMHAAERIKHNIEVFDVKNDGFREVHAIIKKGMTLPKLILVACNENARIVVLEGHARITGLFMDIDYIPVELEVIIGFSEDFVSWGLY